MKNIKQTELFPLFVILGQHIPEDVLLLAKKVVRAEIKQNDAREALLANTPPKVQQMVEAYGAELISDGVNVTLETGSLLYDMYIHGAAKPESPLGKKLFEKQLQELAHTLSQEEISLDQSVHDIIKKVLGSDDLWRKLSASAYVTVNNEKRFFTINSIGVNYFDEILNYVIEHFV